MKKCLFVIMLATALVASCGGKSVDKPSGLQLHIQRQLMNDNTSIYIASNATKTWYSVGTMSDWIGVFDLEKMDNSTLQFFLNDSLDKAHDYWASDDRALFWLQTAQVYQNEQIRRLLAGQR